MASQFVDLFVRAYDQASKILQTVGKSTESLSGKLSALGSAASVAGGMIIADLVRNVSQFTSEAISLGGSVETLKNSFEKLTAEYNLSIEGLREATQGTVADVDLLKAANQAMMLGLPTDQLEDLMNAATTLGHAMGIDALYAVESLTTGLGRQSKLILDNLGVVFQASEAYAWYAEQLGKTSSQLTDTEKKLGWQKYAIEMITEKAEELGDITSDTQKAQESWSATLKNLQTSMGNFLTTALGPAVPLFEQLIPMMTLLGTQVLAQLIAKYGVLTPLKAAYNMIVNSSIGAHIAAAIAMGKESLAMVASTAASVAHQIATWALNAALIVKIGLLTAGIGVAIAVTAAIAGMAAMNQAAAKSTRALGDEAGYASDTLERAGNATEDYGAKAKQAYADITSSSSSLWDKLEQLESTFSDLQAEQYYLSERTRDWAEEFQDANKVVVDGYDANAVAFKKWYYEQNWEQMAARVIFFAEEHNVSLEEAEAALFEYSSAVTYTHEAADRFADVWNKAAAENAHNLDEIAVAFDAAFEAKKFKDAAMIVTQFAETHSIVFEDAEDIILDAVDHIERELTEYELALIQVQEQEAAWAAGQAEIAEENANFVASLQREFDIMKIAADEDLPALSLAFAEAFSKENMESCRTQVSMLISGTSLDLEDGFQAINTYLASVGIELANTFEGIPEAVNESIEEGLINRAQANLETFKNCASGKMTDIATKSAVTWRDIVNDTNDLIRQGLVGQAQDNIQAFTECSTNKQVQMVEDVDDALSTLRGIYDSNISTISALVEEGKLEEAQIYRQYNADISQQIQAAENWRNMIIEEAWNETQRIIALQSSQIFQIVAANTEATIEELVSVVDALSGEQIREITAYGKRSMTSFMGAIGVENMVNYTQDQLQALFSLWSSTFESLEDIAEDLGIALVGHSIWTDMLDKMVSSTKAAMGVIGDETGKGMSSFIENVALAGYETGGIYESIRRSNRAIAQVAWVGSHTYSARGDIDGAVAATNRLIDQAGWIAAKSLKYGDIFDVVRNTQAIMNPPTVNITIEGSADQKTVDKTVKEVKKALRSIIVETTSGGGSVKTSALRV